MDGGLKVNRALLSVVLSRLTDAGTSPAGPEASHLAPVSPLWPVNTSSQSGAAASVQFGTADVAVGGYTRFMASETLKTLLLVAWVIAICVAAIVIGVTSVANWIVVAGAAIVPPLVVRRFWRAPEQTMSESIHEARQ